MLFAGKKTVLLAVPDVQFTVTGSFATAGLAENVQLVACETDAVNVTLPPLLGTSVVLSWNLLMTGFGTAGAALAAGQPNPTATARPTASPASLRIGDFTRKTNATPSLDGLGRAEGPRSQEVCHIRTRKVPGNTAGQREVTT